MKITLFPAKNGDSFLVSWGEQFHILIDTGYADTYTSYLKPTLLQLAERGIALDYCVITHVDADHIEGAVKGLFLENGLSSHPGIAFIKQVWHNSYKQLVPDGKLRSTDRDRFGLKAIIAKGMSTTIKKQNGSRIISMRQGSSLSALLTRNQYDWNSDFTGNAVVGPHRLIIDAKTEFVILSPTVTQLNRLAKRWKADLLKLGIEKELTNNPLIDEAFEYWLAQHDKFVSSQPKQIAARSYSINDLLNQRFIEDNSPTNGSSIAFVVQTNGDRILLLGDAYPSVVAASLEVAYPKEQKPFWFDAIKVSHHGSFGNNSPSLLKLTDSTIYLFSTDGSHHNHPDPETIAWIVTRPLTKGTIRRLYFNYQTPTSKLFENPIWREQHKYDIIYSSYDMPILVTL